MDPGLQSHVSCQKMFTLDREMSRDGRTNDPDPARGDEIHRFVKLSDIDFVLLSTFPLKCDRAT